MVVKGLSRIGCAAIEVAIVDVRLCQACDADVAMEGGRERDTGLSGHGLRRLGHVN